jgi:hypothetical protein
MDAERLGPACASATVLHSDGEWHPATILAWCRHRGEWAVLLRWSDGSQDWRRHDPGCLRTWG